MNSTTQTEKEMLKEVADEINKILERKTRDKEFQNLCAGCGYNMGVEWCSQFCSRSCMYESLSTED